MSTQTNGKNAEASQYGMLKDILDSPEMLRRIYCRYVERDHPALREAATLLRKSQPVIMTGMVTSEFGAYPASISLNRAGISNFVYEAAELLHYHLPLVCSPGCLVAISQSGESAEVVHLLQALDRRVPTVGVFNSEESYLANACDIGLPLYAGSQRTCGTKTNLATVAVLLLLAEATLSPKHRPSGRLLLKLAESLDRLIMDGAERFSPAADFLTGAQVFTFLGRGPGLISAKFSAVLFREVTKCVAEGLSAAAYRHGLLEALRQDQRVIIFAPAGATHDLCIGFAKQLFEYGVPVMLVTNRPVDLEAEEKLFILKTDPFDEYWAPILDMVPLQLIGYLLARRMGLIPGELTLASYVTRVE